MKPFSEKCISALRIGVGSSAMLRTYQITQCDKSEDQCLNIVDCARLSILTLCVFVVTCHLLQFFVVTCHLLQFFVVTCHLLQFFVVTCHLLQFFVVTCHLLQFFPPDISRFEKYCHKGKGKGHPRTGHEGPEGEYMYSYTLPSTSALDGRGWSTSRPGRFTPPERPGTHCIADWVGPRASLDRCGKSLLIPGFDPQTVQYVASHYTHWAIPDLQYCQKLTEK
jgi:hypothetical protein